MLNILYVVLSQNIDYEYQFRVACIGYSVVRDKYYVHNIHEISRYKLIVQVPSERINVYECCFLKKNSTRFSRYAGLGEKHAH